MVINILMQEVRYYHIALGYNLRMTELQAAIGLAQIEKLEYFTQRRIANAAFLTERLKGVVQTPIVRPACRHVFHQYTIRVLSGRNEWLEKLQARGIETTIHYPIPIHQQPFYQRMSSLFRVLTPEKRTRVRGLEQLTKALNSALLISTVDAP